MFGGLNLEIEKIPVTCGFKNYNAMHNWKLMAAIFFSMFNLIKIGSYLVG